MSMDLDICKRKEQINNFLKSLFQDQHEKKIIQYNKLAKKEKMASYVWNAT